MAGLVPAVAARTQRSGSFYVQKRSFALPGSEAVGGADQFLPGIFRKAHSPADVSRGSRLEPHWWCAGFETRPYQTLGALYKG